MKKISFIKIVVLLLISLSISCNKIIKPQHRVEVVPVEVQVISEMGEAASQNYVGTVQASSEAALSFSVAGRVAQMYVREGQRVAQGQLLAEIDDASFQQSYVAAQATLRQAQDGYDRLKQLHDKGSITEVQWVEIETKLAQAKSMESISRKNLDNCKLYAPFSGVVGKCELEAGMNAMPGMTALSLLKVGQVNVSVPIPENLIAEVRVGQPASIMVSALNQRVFSGKIRSKGVIANPLSHNYEVVIPLNNSDGVLLPGMVCNVRLQSADSTQLISLPNRVIKIAPDGHQFVWVIENGSAQQRAITTSGLSQHGVIVAAGLSCGDSVIVNGEQKVSTGSKVKIQ